MNRPLLRNLDLRAPLIYIKAKNPPLDDFLADSKLDFAENEEILLCFSLDPDQCRSIEPETAQFISSIAFTGRKIIVDEGNINASEEQTVSLPAGNYLFMQNRSVNREPGNDSETLSQSITADEWLELAIEQHKDGLWEHNKMQNVLYARFLREDGFLVTQVFRPMV